MHYATKEALKAQHRKYYLAHRAEKLAYQKAYRERNAEKVRETNRQWNAKNGNYDRRKIKERERYYTTARDSVLYAKYRIREADVAKLLAEQGGVCAICGGTHLLGVDHCHDTGIVRGILCRTCNSGIGHLKDNLELVERAAVYLRRYKKDSSAI